MTFHDLSNLQPTLDPPDPLPSRTQALERSWIIRCGLEAGSVLHMPPHPQHKHTTHPSLSPKVQLECWLEDPLPTLTSLL